MPTSHQPQIPLSHLIAAPNPARRFRLLEQVRRGLRLRHYSKRTEVAYCAWVRRFVLFHDRIVCEGREEGGRCRPFSPIPPPLSSLALGSFRALLSREALAR